jgi:hypothetical protein
MTRRARIALVASAAIMALAVSGIKVSMDRSTVEDHNIRSLQIHARCGDFWSNRSAIADATFEFENERRGLISAEKTFEPVLEYWTPGLRANAVAEVRKGDFLDGPNLGDLMQKPISAFEMQRDCNPVNYAWDYNVTMLRLLGRERDTNLRPVSLELKSRKH